MKAVSFSEPASDELIEAVKWYEQQRPGLGAELFDSVAHTIELIQANTEIGVLREGRFPSRQFHLQRFPYRIVYRERQADVCIVAIAHTSRRPNYWKDRR